MACSICTDALILIVPATVVLALTIDLAAPSDLDVGERAQSRPPPRGARLRGDARGRDGGVCEELTAGVGMNRDRTDADDGGGVAGAA
jgi:hypothetical protein